LERRLGSTTEWAVVLWAVVAARADGTVVAAVIAASPG
jgi:hypothetical protein